jgi:hypothetical protein
MRCCGSPTISTAAEDASAPQPRDVVAALLFREILKPLAAGLGPVGEVALEEVADGLFVRVRR